MRDKWSESSVPENIFALLLYSIGYRILSFRVENYSPSGLWRLSPMPSFLYPVSKMKKVKPKGETSLVPALCRWAAASPLACIIRSTAPFFFSCSSLSFHSFSWTSREPFNLNIPLKSEKFFGSVLDIFVPQFPLLSRILLTRWGTTWIHPLCLYFFFHILFSFSFRNISLNLSL